MAWRRSLGQWRAVGIALVSALLLTSSATADTLTFRNY